MAQVKELKEALIAVVKVAIEVKKVAKDGLQLQDAMALYAAYQANPALKKAVDDGLAGLSGLGDEAKDLDLKEIVELLMALAPEVVAFVEA
jgi:hypothetical protein